MNHNSMNHKRRLPDDTDLFESPALDYLHGASIIDETGTETLITEQMIQQACDELIHAWETTSTSAH